MATPPAPRSLFHALRHLELHVVVEIANRRHARALVDRLLDFRRHRHVLDDEAGHLQAVLGADDRIDQRQQRVAQLRVAAGDVEHRNLRRGQRVREHAHDPRPHGVGELVEPEILIRSGNFFQEQLRIDDVEIVGAEGARPDDAEVFVAHHDRIGGSPLVAGEQPRVQVVDVGLERRVEAVLPRFQLRQHRDVVGRQRVLAGTERVTELAEVDELHLLRLAHDQLRAVLDRLVVIGIAEREGVARVVCPLDDVDQLALDEIHQAHGSSPRRSWMVEARPLRVELFYLTHA